MRITSKEYFLTKLDTTIPALSGLPALAEAGKMDEAEHVYAEFVRAQLQPEKFFRIPYYDQENAWKSRGESEEDVYHRLQHGAIMSCGYLHDFGEAGIQWEANPTPNAYNEWPWQINRHHEFRMLAHLYRETGDEEVAALFVKLFTSWRAQTECPDNAPGGATWSWRTIELGIREALNWHYALHAFYRSPAITDHFLCEFFCSMWENGWRLRNFATHGNWLIMEMSGLYQIGLLYPWVKDAADWKKYAEDRLEAELDRQVYPDGFQYELTTNYHGVIIENYIRAMDISVAMGEPLPDFYRKGLERTYDLYPKLADPSFHLPDLNDGNPLDISEQCRRALSLFPDRADYRYFAARRAEGAPPVYTDVVLPYSGMVVLRDSWEADSQWAFFESAPFGRGHQHEDKLNFLLYAYGRRLLRDTGSFAYDSSMMRRYVLSSYAHNVVLVDGLGQARGKTYKWEDGDIKKLSDLEVELGAARDVARGIYNEGFGRDLLDVTHRRTVVKVKDHPLGLKTFYLIIDRLEAADGQAHEYAAHWQLESVPLTAMPGAAKPQQGHDGPTYQSPYQYGSRLMADYGGGVTLTLLSGQNCNIRIGQDRPFVGWRTPNVPAPAVDFTAYAPSARIVTLLYPSDDGCPITAISYDPSVEAKEITVHTPDGDWTFTE